MVRAMVLLGLGLGLGSGSEVADAAWLLLLLGALTAVIRPRWWRVAKAVRTLGVRIEPTVSHHFHYCPACDAQWSHPGEGTICTEHWAWRCPACSAGDGAPPAAA